MSAGTWVAVGALGGVGAVVRFALTSRVAGGPPHSTLAVNLVGAFALGVLSTAGLGDGAYLVAGGGFLGAFTTFSTWMAEVEERRSGVLLVGALALGLGAAALGRVVGGGL